MPLPSQFAGLQMLNVAPVWQFVLKAIVLVPAVRVEDYFKKNR
jgi:predicted ABC-type sugar transport system permease subunit